MISILKRKIYYVPGLMSAILLPIYFYIVIDSYKHKQYTVIKYCVPIDASSSNYVISFTGKTFMKSIRRKKLIPFYLNENHELNNKKIDFIRNEALRLKFTCDTNTVIAVHLSDGVWYGEFIQLLNIMMKDDHKRYVEWKNIFYILGEEPPDPKLIEPEIMYLDMVL